MSSRGVSSRWSELEGSELDQRLMSLSSKFQKTEAEDEEGKDKS